MKEIALDHPVAKVTVFYVEEYNSIILRQESRKTGFVDVLLTISQLQELVKKLVEIDCVKEQQHA